jgi:hypothetical protein
MNPEIILWDKLYPLEYHIKNLERMKSVMESSIDKKKAKQSRQRVSRYYHIEQELEALERINKSINFYKNQKQ